MLITTTTEIIITIIIIFYALYRCKKQGRVKPVMSIVI